ncbi:hypothetical protein LTR85_007504 [Meristemomyces frigidus]|nr:hypothetical protein LTR85_007504 [Meristemomyces frigidus]
MLSFLKSLICLYNDIFSFSQRLIGLLGPRTVVKPATSPSFDGKLPPEIRLQIYGYLLHSDHPLKRPNEETLQDRRAHTAILGVNKLISEEATESFYEHNTFVLELADVLRSDSSATEPSIDAQQLDGKPYGDLQISCNLDYSAADARKCDLVRVLAVLRVFGHICETKPPKLRTVFFRLGNNNFNSLTRVLGDLFATSGSKVVFTAVGRFELTPCLPHEPKVVFEYSDIAVLWDNLSALRPGDRCLEQNCPSIPAQLEYLPGTLLGVPKGARVWLKAEYSVRRNFAASAGEQKTWASVPHSSEKLQEITEYLVRAL